MAKDVTLWNRIMKAALAIPGVAVDREAYLLGALRDVAEEDKLSLIVEGSPAAFVEREALDRIASGAITYHTATVTTLSTVTGLPGGPAIVASIPADLAQYYFHVFVLAQKMAYLYGFPDMRDEKGHLTEDATDMLTLFVGIMMGAKLARDAVRDISRDLALQVAKKMPQQALTRTVYYPIVKQVAKRIGVDLSKSSFTKTFGRFIPLLGGIVSGGVTYATFYPGARRLQRALQGQLEMQFSDADIAAEAQQAASENEQLERLAMRALVNMALMDDSETRRKHDFLRKQLEHTSLEDAEKADILEAFYHQRTFKVDFAPFREDPVNSTRLMRLLVETIRLSDKISVTAKIYLNKISRELGYSPQDVDEFLTGCSS
ncbi:MAG: hypothetical protein IJ659_05315 [Alloprevotella sp.]|nr:hypothetical protein [Alloprevotella sp.]